MLPQKICRPCLPLILISCLSTACGNHDPQPTVKAFEGTRSPPGGTIPRGQYHYVLGTNGYPEDVRLDEDYIAEGQKYFDRTCAACHGFDGHGDGIASQRGLSDVPNLHSTEAKNFSPEDIFNLMSDGMGRMPSYARRLSAHERWKIAAFVKTLQLSSEISVDRLDPDDREKLP